MFTTTVDRSANPTDAEVLTALADSSALLIADVSHRAGQWATVRESFIARLRAQLEAAEQRARAAGKPGPGRAA